MNLLDFTIIYLAGGAPFGVFYYLQNRQSKKSLLFWAKTFCAFIFWFLFAVSLFRERLNFKDIQFFPAHPATKIPTIQKQIEDLLIDNDSEISIYNLREVFERYAGLASLIYTKKNHINNAEQDFFRIVGNNNTELQSICFHRNNHKKTLSHLNLARADFLHVFTNLNLVNKEKQKLGKLIAEFVGSLNDLQALKTLDDLFPDFSQKNVSDFDLPLNDALWNSETHERKIFKQISPKTQHLQQRIYKAKAN